MIEFLRILAATLGTGLSVWLLPASTDIVAWTPAGIGRVAVFGPLFALPITIAASLAIAGVLHGLARRDRARVALLTP
jgi:hypothetical protein